MSNRSPGKWFYVPLGDGGTVEGGRFNLDGSIPIIADVVERPEAHSNGRLLAAAPELLDELKKAHQIIINALNVMTTEQKMRWDDRNERDGVKDGMATTRNEARSLAIAKAEGRG